MSITITDAFDELGLRSTVRRPLSRIVAVLQRPTPIRAPRPTRVERALRHRAAERCHRRLWDRLHTDPLVNHI